MLCYLKLFFKTKKQAKILEKGNIIDHIYLFIGWNHIVRVLLKNICCVVYTTTKTNIILNDISFLQFYKKCHRTLPKEEQPTPYISFDHVLDEKIYKMIDLSIKVTTSDPSVIDMSVRHRGGGGGVSNKLVLKTTVVILFVIINYGYNVCGGHVVNKGLNFCCCVECFNDICTTGHIESFYKGLYVKAGYYESLAKNF